MSEVPWKVFPTPVSGAMVLNLPRETAKDVLIRAVLDRMAREGLIDPAEIPDCERSILNREALGSTGVGEGLACPILVSRTLPPQAALCVVRVPAGIEFDSLDHEPVDLLLVQLRPWALLPQRREFFRTLEWISRCAKRPDLLSRLRRAQTENELWTAIHACCEQIPYQKQG
jgi:mannitol/fructose-specific phosphotransferase system IIA component (Ntr-type)